MFLTMEINSLLFHRLDSYGFSSQSRHGHFQFLPLSATENSGSVLALIVVKNSIFILEIYESSRNYSEFSVPIKSYMSTVPRLQKKIIARKRKIIGT